MYVRICICQRVNPTTTPVSFQVKDRFKGPRTKYYVLKAFSSTAEVFLRLLYRAMAEAEMAMSGNSSLRRFACL